MANLVRRLLSTSSRGIVLSRSIPDRHPRGFVKCRLMSTSAETTTTSSESDFPSGPPLAPLHPDELGMEALTPSKVVELLDRHIVGQREAKRAVAVALRNRWRRHRIPESLKEEIVPKNILMIGPTGCGKTEIARRLAKIAYAPFVKVEATKFTEVGFHGRDVDQIIRDLVDNAISLQRQKVRVKLVKEVERAVEARLLDIFISRQRPPVEGESPVPARIDYEAFRKLYRDGALDNRKIQLDIPDGRSRLPLEIGGVNGFGVNELIFRMPQMEKVFKSQRMERMEITIGEAKPLLREVEMEKHLNSDQITKDAILLAESDGIVFIDEIDKIVTNHETRHGADASSEGVQRDLLPIIEGSMVSTKYGNVNTDHILFICSGAFHSCKPSDMLAELQGRLPIRVELKGLGREDLYRILTEPETNMIRQQQLLMKTEDIHLVFTDEAIEELAAVAAEVNRSVDNIGARRLHTVIERVVEEISFHAPERAGETYTIDKEVIVVVCSKNSTQLEHMKELSVYTPASEATKRWGDVAQKDSQQRMLQVVLVSPQIPGNTGCIARTCAATCVGLHLVEPLGYKIEDAKLKRAGLDYWPYVVVKVHKSWSDFFDYFQQQEGKKRLLAYTKKGSCVHTDVKHEGGDWLLFGSEVDGLPSAALEQCSTGQYAGGTIRLPMSEAYVRSLNLSVSAGVAVYEALRQLDAHTNYSSLDVSPIEAMESANSGHNDGFP